MTTAFDLIGRNAAFDEHWIRRLFAIIIDSILISVVTAIIAIPLVLLANWWVSSFLFGALLWIYSGFLEGTMGGTIGKKLLSLRVVALDQAMDPAKAFIRNVSKIHPLLLLLDLIIGAATPGDPRQRYLDRIARTTVTRVDQQAYMEEQFRMMQHVPPHPQAPPPGAYPPAAAPPPGQAPPGQAQGQAPAPGGWPQQPAGTWPGYQPQPSNWPQHQWDEEGKLKPQMRFCTACGGQLVARGDGRLTCVRCGAVY